jgi:molecular chaperone Hsp33
MAERDLASPGGRLEAGLAAAGSLRWAAVDLGLPLEEARRRLDLSPVSAVALGRSLTAAALIQRISLKSPARIVLEVLGDGPLGKVIAEADHEGGVRGMVSNPRVPTPEDGQMKIAPLLGRGRLRVTREIGSRRYSSQVSLVSGELADDVTHFLEQSEQVRSAILLGVLPRPSGIAAAGGLAVEALPGTDDEIVEALEENIRSVRGVSRLLDEGGIAALIGRVLCTFEPELREERTLEYRCRCSRESLLSQILPLAQRDPEALLAGTDHCEAICAFCGDRYLFTRGELTAIQ